MTERPWVPPVPTVAELTQRAGTLRARLDALGGPQVRVLAVSKGHVPQAAANAVAVGLCDLGENYAQELASKAKVLALQGIEPNWHFIGRLQRNKVRRIADVVTRWESVDRIELAEEIARRSPGARILVQVNVSEEPGKGGCDPADLESVLSAAADAGLRAEGLMAVGRTGSPELARVGFRRLRGLCDQYDLPECSMGMSGDLEVAVQEGSTMVRIGTDLFGPRQRR